MTYSVLMCHRIPPKPSQTKGKGSSENMNLGICCIQANIKHLVNLSFSDRDVKATIAMWRVFSEDKQLGPKYKITSKISHS